MSAMKRLSTFFDRIISVMALLAAALLAFSVISVSISVATRYFFDYPVGWVTEINGYVLLYVTFMAAAWVLKEDGHVMIDIAVEQLEPKPKALLNITTSFLCVLVCLILTFFGARETWELYKTGYFTPTELELPKWIINIIISFGSLLLAMQFFRKGSGYLSAWKDAEEDHGIKDRIREFEI